MSSRSLSPSLPLLPLFLLLNRKARPPPPHPRLILQLLSRPQTPLQPPWTRPLLHLKLRLQPLLPQYLVIYSRFISFTYLRAFQPLYGHEQSEHIMTSSVSLHPYLFNPSFLLRLRFCHSLYQLLSQLLRRLLLLKHHKLRHFLKCQLQRRHQQLQRKPGLPSLPTLKVSSSWRFSTCLLPTLVPSIVHSFTLCSLAL